MNALVERVAEAIYRHSGGITDEEHLAIFGVPRKAWKTDAPWDTNPNELAEHERDEYRMQARAAIQAVLGDDD